MISNAKTVPSRLKGSSHLGPLNFQTIRLVETTQRFIHQIRLNFAL